MSHPIRKRGHWMNFFVITELSGFLRLGNGYEYFMRFFSQIYRELYFISSMVLWSLFDWVYVLIFACRRIYQAVILEKSISLEFLSEIAGVQGYVTVVLLFFRWRLFVIEEFKFYFFLTKKLKGGHEVAYLWNILNAYEKNNRTYFDWPHARKRTYFK